MFDYTRLATAELIELLFKAEDRVERKHIEELAGRGEEAAARLREILRTEDYWYEGRDGDYWIGLHATVILSVMQDEQALPDLIEMVPHLYFSNHDWAVEILPAALAQFGERAVELYIKFIEDYRGAFRDNPDYSHCRHDFSIALTMIARKHAEVRGRIADFICGLFTDPQEDDEIFLSFCATHPVVLDRERGMKALQTAYDRGVIKEGVIGKFGDFVKSLRRSDPELLSELKAGVFDFYQPEAIKERQRHKAAEKEEPLYWEPEPVTAAPAGYSASPAGPIVRSEKVGRNDPCPCGSGKKYKKCCGANTGD